MAMNEGAIFGNSQVMSGTQTFQNSTKNTGGLQVKSVTAQGTATAAKTFSIAVNVPTNCAIIGCQMNVDVALTSSDGGTAWSAAYATGATAACATSVAFTANTKVTKFFNPNAATPITSNTTTILVTADSSATFAAGGKVTAIVYYLTMDNMADV